MITYFEDRIVIGKVLVLTQGKAKRFSYDKPWACISIDTDGDFPKINAVQRVDLLQLVFGDNDGPGADCGHAGETFSEQQAHKIYDFVEKVWDNIELLMVHCYAGVSRSPAIAAAIHKVFYEHDNSDYWAHYTPNAKVYSTMLEVAHKRYPDGRKQ